MKKECAFERLFNEHMDWICEKENRELCYSKNCDCACAQIAGIARACREKHFDHREYGFLTVFEKITDLKIGDLYKFDVIKSRSRLVLKLRRLSIPGLRLIGGFDVQLQDYIAEGRIRRSRWLPHWHCLIVADVPFNVLKSRIYLAFNAGNTKRMALLKPGADEPYGCTYLFKPIDKFKKKLASTEGGQSKRQFSIKGKARRELEKFLKHDNRLNWIALIGFRRYGNRIVPLTLRMNVINKNANLQKNKLYPFV